MNFLKKILNFLWSIAKHPFTGVAIGIIVALFVYMLSRATKEPVFSVSPPELVAQTIHSEEKLKIFWDNEEIHNATSVKIALWNNGSKFIDKSDISSTDPIKIISADEDINILAVKALRTSRTNLNFETKKENNKVIVKIIGDEALEKFDGAIFHILYSGKQDCIWKVSGRIKGIPGGFKQKDWSKVHPPPTKSFSIAILLIAVLMTVLGTILAIMKAMHKAPPVPWTLIISSNIYSIFFIFYILLRDFSYLLAPSWIY